MMIMINGCFGVGKTSVAYELRSLLPAAAIFDPEEVGPFVRRVTDGLRDAEEETDDFQDIVLWRDMTVATAQALYRRYRRTLILPMTIADPGYFAIIRDRLARCAQPLYHFCLTAPLAVIQERLIRRGDGPGSWPWRKTLAYQAPLAHARFREHIATEERTVQAVAAEIAQRLADGTAVARQYPRRG